jgi:hypothetical protein
MKHIATAKSHFFLLGLLLIGLLIHSDDLTAGSTIREKITINREWRFQLGDSVNAQRTTFDDSKWSRIGLPHSFSLPYFLWSTVYNGYGWYRKQIDVPVNWNGKTVTLEFEGVFIEAEIYVNGTYIGKHVGGYTGFVFDITNQLKTGTNLLAFRVNNKWNARVAPRAGDHQFSGGIYRDVYLNVTDKLHVDWYGTFVTTPSVSAASAVCKLQTDVRNDHPVKKVFSITTEIFDPGNNLVSTYTSTDSVGLNSLKTITQVLPAIPNPKLWSTNTPYLYSAKTTLTQEGTVVDTFETRFGIRWFSWTSDQGFFLNGEHLYLLGANVHQDQAGWGDAVTNQAARRDVQLMKDAGFNCIRGSHYPHDPAFTQACDELGILYFSENAFWGMGGSSGDQNGWGTPSSSCYPPVTTDQPFFNKSVLAQLKEEIRIHRNRASIAAWSMCNEPFFTDNSTLTAMKALLNLATDSSRMWDPSRAVAIGGSQRQDIDKLGKGQIAFYNGDGASRTESQNPGVPNMVSEYGSTTSDRPGTFAPGWGDVGNGMSNRPAWRSGQVIWCGFDHGTVGGTGLATMGLVDYFRLPKRSYYWYQQAYAQGIANPVAPTWPASGTAAKLKLESSSKVIASTDGTDDVQLVVSLLNASGNRISNNVPVKLQVVSGPGEFPTGTSINFATPSTTEASDIAIRDGQCAIAFRSYYGGTTLIRATSPGLTADSLYITTQGLPSYEEGVTPKVTDRPYHRYLTSGVNSSLLDMLLVKNRPVWVSSTLTGTKSSNINDDDNTTLWKPETTDTAKWVILDMEGSYSITRLQLEFPTTGAYRYTIEVTPDGSTWKKVIDQSVSSLNDKLRLAYGNLGENVRQIRIRFTSALAGLAEVKVGGAANYPLDKNLLTGTVLGTAGSWNSAANATREAAFDFDPTTFFDAPSGAVAPMWAGLDLGYQALYNVTKVRYIPRSNIPARMVSGTFDVANNADFSDKQTISTVTATPAINVYTTAAITNATYSRYVRFGTIASGNGNVAELEFYGIPKETSLVPNQLRDGLRTMYDKGGSRIVLSMDRPREATVSIFTMDGRRIGQDRTDGTDITISTTNYQPGIYLVTVTANDKTYYEKMLVY